jgi:VWFA-related protein
MSSAQGKPRLSRIFLLLVTALTAVLALPGGLSSQEGRESIASTFIEAIDVNVVNVEVYITDRNGDPVTGLERGDFEILEDGRPVAITNFYAVASGQPAVPAAAEEPAAEPADEVPDRPTRRLAAQIPEDQRLHLVVYIDNFNIRPLNRNRVFSQLRRFLFHRLGPEDRVMLVSYDPGVHVRQPFTSDGNVVAGALDELEKLAGHALQVDRERREIRDAIERGSDPSNVGTRVRQYAASVSQDLDRTIRALRETIQTLAGLPGRKALLYVSDGLPMTPAQDLFLAAQRRLNDISVLAQAREFDATRRFEQLAAHANASRLSFYTVDATGLQSYTSAQAETARTSSVDTLDSFIDSTATANLQSSIKYLAERTGGQAIVNANDITRGLDRVAMDFGNYYSLGFTTANQGIGRYHSIEVRVPSLGKGYTVRHREGYRSKSASDRMVDATVSGLRYGFESNPLEIGLELGGQSPSEKGFVVPIHVRIPLGKVALVPRAATHEARLEVFVSTLSEDGSMSDVQRETLPILIPSQDVSDAVEQHYSYVATLLMRRGLHRVGIGVRDEFGGAFSLVTQQVRVGSE